MSKLCRRMFQSTVVLEPAQGFISVVTYFQGRRLTWNVIVRFDLGRAPNMDNHLIVVLLRLLHVVLYFGTMQTHFF